MTLNFKRPTLQINGVTLVQTCGACPEQYDAYIDDKKIAYLRLRHEWSGHTTIRAACQRIGSWRRCGAESASERTEATVETSLWSSVRDSRASRRTSAKITEHSGRRARIVRRTLLLHVVSDFRRVRTSGWCWCKHSDGVTT